MCIVKSDCPIVSRESLVIALQVLLRISKRQVREDIARVESNSFPEVANRSFVVARVMCEHGASQPLFMRICRVLLDQLAYQGECFTPAIVPTSFRM
jgi:hypothetical protein